MLEQKTANSTIWIIAMTICLLGINAPLAEMPLFVQTYDYIPPQLSSECEGLRLEGVTYGFTVDGAPSQNCNAGTNNGPADGTAAYLEKPNIEGSAAGVLHLRFDRPTTVFGFGVAVQNRETPQPEAIIVSLYRPGVGLLQETLVLDAILDPEWAGARYDYQGPAVKTVTIQFSGRFIRFALDNLTYFGRAETFTRP